MARRAGLTLIEMLIAVALTLLVVLAIVRVFDVLGTNVTQSRAILELSGELRGAANLMQADLDRVTAPTLPPLDPQSGLGYLEIVEGIRTDWDSDGDRFSTSSPDRFNPRDDLFEDPIPLFDPVYLQSISRTLGDVDDVFMATIRSAGEPFVGRLQRADGTTDVIQSELAEVVWWVDVRRPRVPRDMNDDVGVELDAPSTKLSVHRRILLIRPDLTPQIAGWRFGNAEQLLEFLRANDLSVRPQGDQLIANSLSDLTRRENRFAHWHPAVFLAPDYQLDGFPFPVYRQFLAPASDGSDLVLGDALAFDIRVYDPSAPLLPAPTPSGQVPTYLLTPTDPGFYDVARLNQIVPVGQGAFVDLGFGDLLSVDPTAFGNGLKMYFANLPHAYSFYMGPYPKSGLNQPVAPGYVSPNAYDNRPSSYCTWSTHYEQDGIDQDGDWVNNPNLPGYTLRDEGTNGLDDLTDVGGIPGVVDDAGEKETSPPYPLPLRGVEILLRAQEYSTRQIRQVSVIGDFLPE
jgi:hypothetical protein